MFASLEVQKRIVGQARLVHFPTVTDIEDWIKILPAVGLKGHGCGPIELAAVEKVHEGQDPFVDDAAVAIERDDAREVRALMPQLRPVPRLVKQGRDDFIGSDRRPARFDALRFGEVARKHSGVVAVALRRARVAGR